MPCVVCGMDPTDIDHIRSRGAGGSDEWWNVWELCRRDHQERHRIGLPAFVEKHHPNTTKALDDRGWKVERFFGIRKVVRK